MNHAYFSLHTDLLVVSQGVKLFFYNLTELDEPELIGIHTLSLVIYHLTHID